MTRETSFAVFGVGIWPGRLAAALSAAGEASNRSIAATAYGPDDIIRWLGSRERCDVAVRLGLRPGAATPRGVAFDAAWSVGRYLSRWREEVVFWIGTDVYRTLTELTRYTTWQLQRTRGATHLTAAPWLTDDLARLGLTACTTFFPLRLPVGPATPVEQSLPLRVLTYLPQERWDFYGAQGLLDVVARRPRTVHLDIAGSARVPSGYHVPSNVTLLGWVTDLGDRIDSSHVVARTVRHDAFGGTAVEALRRGRHLIYSYPVEGARYVPFGDVDALGQRIDELVQALAQRCLPVNEAGRAAVATRDYTGDAVRLLDAIMGIDCDRAT